MGVWGWNELKRNGQSDVTITGEVVNVVPSGGAFLEGDNDWNIDVVPDGPSWWCLTDPEHPTHQNVSVDKGKTLHFIECEVEPVAQARVPGGVLDLRTPDAFKRFVAPLKGKRVTINGYWARDRSHGYDSRASAALSNFGDDGKMEIHPIVWLLWYEETGEFRILAFSDASRQDHNRQNIESVIDGGLTGGDHVPHRGESHGVVIEVPNHTGIPGAEVALELLEQEIADVDAKTEQISPSTGNVTFHITTGEAPAGRGFYACHGKLVRRAPQPKVTRHYGFRVDKLTVNNPRSGSIGGLLTVKGKDTDYATLAAMVMRPGGEIVQDLGVKTLKLGDLGEGAVKDLGWEVDAHVPSDAALVWTFEVINYSGSDPHIREKMETAARVILVDGVASGVLLGLGLASWIPALGSLGLAGVVAGIGELVSLLSPNCDGWVVNGNGKRPEGALNELTAGAPGLRFTWSEKYPGYDSASGCGSNSVYTVEYSIVSRQALKVTTSPAPTAIATGAETTFTVTALDADNGQPVPGDVFVEGGGAARRKVGRTGAPITTTLPKAYWRRVPPPPPPPPRPRPPLVAAELSELPKEPPPRPGWILVRPALVVVARDYPEVALAVGPVPPHPDAPPSAAAAKTTPKRKVARPTGQKPRAKTATRKRRTAAP
jgi:hypothetical protein